MPVRARRRRRHADPQAHEVADQRPRAACRRDATLLPRLPRTTRNRSRQAHQDAAGVPAAACQVHHQDRQEPRSSTTPRQVHREARAAGYAQGLLFQPPRRQRARRDVARGFLPGRPDEPSGLGRSTRDGGGHDATSCCAILGRTRDAPFLENHHGARALGIDQDPDLQAFQSPSEPNRRTLDAPRMLPTAPHRSRDGRDRNRTARRLPTTALHRPGQARHLLVRLRSTGQDEATPPEPQPLPPEPALLYNLPTTPNLYHHRPSRKRRSPSLVSLQSPRRRSAKQYNACTSTSATPPRSS